MGRVGGAIPGVRRRAALALAMAVGALVASGCDDGGAEPLHAWLQLGPSGERSARAITAAPSCPAIEVDGRRSPMRVRAAPEAPAFPVLTCEAIVPAQAKRAAIAGRELPLPPAKLEHVAILGDTGCRVLEGHEVQDCADDGSWPFGRLAAAVADFADWLRGDDDLDDLARSIATIDPDLVVHVGDYIYREASCPDGAAACSEGAHGYDWDAMSADFFEPAEPLLRAAPLLLARGNHELCSRAGEAWFRFLDARPYDGTCSDVTEPWAADVGGVRFLMLDSASAPDRTAEPEQVEIFRGQVERLGGLATPRSLLVSHRPMWVFVRTGSEGGREVLSRGNATLQAAAGNRLPPGVAAVLSGHVHMFQALGFDPPRPPQIVVGNGGTGLDPAVETPLVGLEIGDAVVATGVSRSVFGFATLQVDGAGWRLTLRELDGAAAVLACVVVDGEALRCS